jgi:hypothetical protein
MPGDADPLTAAPAPARPLRLLVAGAAATIVVGFVVGFALGGRSGDGGDVTAAGSIPTSSSSPTTAAPPSTGGSSSTTSPPASSTTTRPSTTSSSAPVAVTEAPPTTSPTSAVVTTAAPPPSVATTVAPSRVVVSYGTDGSGRLVIPRSGSASLVITNEGGLAQQWLVTGTGFTTVGPAQGSVGPGQTTVVTVVAPPGELPSGELTGTISVLGAVNPSIAFVIPPA